MLLNNKTNNYSMKFIKNVIPFLLFFFVKILIQIQLYNCIPNPGPIGGTYPKSLILKTDQTSFLIFSDKLYKFALLTGTITDDTAISNHNFEIGALSSSNLIAFTETQSTNTFIITAGASRLPFSGTRLNNVYDFNQLSPISMFSFPSGSTINYGYAVWVYNNEIQMVSFTTSAEIKRKSYSGRKVGDYIDCKGFSSEQFICVYTGKEITDNDACFIHVFKSDLEQIYSERELYSVGCFSSTAQKIFLLNETQNKFFVCYIKSNSLYCIKAYHSQGYYETLIQGTLILNNCRDEIYNFDIGQLNSYFLAVCANGENIYIKQFDENLTLKGVIPSITISGGSIVMPSLVYFNLKNTVLTYSNNAASQSFYQIFIFPECINFSVTTTINSKLLIDFTPYIDNNGYDGAKVQINSLPSNGYLFDTVGNIKAITSSQYELDKLEYHSTNVDGTYEFTFLGTNSFFSSSNCKVSITVLHCYFTCFTCTQTTSTPQDHQCLSCDNSKGYYEVEGYNQDPTALFCGNRTMAPSNFYFDTTSSKYKKCPIECGSCLDNNPSICTSCATGYHWENINRNSCVNIQPAHTYLDTPTDTYLPCYLSCDTCTEKGTNAKHNCNSCLSNPPNNFYKIEGYPTNCVNENTKPKHFFLDSNIYKECDESCETCTALTTCTQCAEDFYPYLDDKNTCVNDETKKENYYFDYDDLLYKECDNSCKTCSDKPTGSSKNCLSCSTNYLYLGNCISQCPEPTFGYDNFCIYPCPEFTSANKGSRICEICAPIKYLYEGECINGIKVGTYVINTNYNILAKCYPNCKNCYGGGTYTNMQCTDCINGYLPLEDKPYQCYNSEPDYYYTSSKKYMPCYESCLKCNGGGSDYNHNCKTCRVGYIKDPYKSENCYKECEYYWYKEITYPYEFKCTKEKKCPTNYPYLEPITKECAISCSQCQGCNTKNLYDLDNTCVDTCPENSIRDDSRNKCHTVTDPESLMNYGIHNYIVDATDQPNKYLLGDEMYFHLCNSTDNGIADCKNISTHMGLSYANLSDCFKVLSSIYHYDIAAGDYFFFGVFEKLRNDTTTSQFYYVIFDKNGIKLDTDYCLNSEINVTKSYLNHQETIDAIAIYDKWGYNILEYTKDNSFFSDICTQFYTEDNYDILLNDRYEYFYKNRTYYFCEENCKLIDVFPNTSEIMCKCMNKENTFDDIKFLKAETQINKIKDQPLQYFMCANLVFSSDTFKKNIPNYFIIIFLILQIIFCIYFYKVGRKPFYSFIHNKLLLDGTNEAPHPNNTQQTANPPRRASVILDKVKAEQAQKEEDEKQIGEQYAKVFIMNQNYTDGEEYEPGDEKKKVQSNGGNGDLSSSLEHENVPKRRAGVALPGAKIYGAPTSTNNNEDDEVSRLARQLKLEQQEKKFSEEVLSKYPDTSFNFLYSFCIKRKHKILSLFYNKDIYDILSFKLSFLILSFTIDFFITTLFFFNFHLRSLFHHLKHYRLVYEIGFGIISAIVSYLVVKFLRWIMEYKSSFKRYEIQNGAEEDKREYFNKMNNLMFNLNVKFVFYYIFMFMGTIFMWYFVTSFCSTYPKSQLSWGIGIATNIIISLIFPFIYYAIIVFMQHTGLVKMKLNLYKTAMFFIRF